MITIFDYTSYRLFMRDFYEQEKKKNVHFSYRYIAQHVGFKSPGLFNQIINGKTKLSNHLLAQFCKLFKLTEREARYFELLMHLEHAKTADEKKYYSDLVANYSGIKKKIIPPEQFVFYKKWYYTAVHKLLIDYTFTGDYKKLAKMLEPPITPAEARKAIQVLLELHVITINEKGVYEVTHAHLSPGNYSGTACEGLLPALLQNLDIAKDALCHLPLDERMAKTYICSIHPSTYALICEEIKEFYTRLYAKVKNFQQNEPKDIKKIYCLSTQLFPITKSIKK